VAISIASKLTGIEIATSARGLLAMTLLQVALQADMSP
jgi:hypothetical protein